MDPTTARLLAASAGAAGAASKLYIEDAFSTFLYTGNDSTQTITNGIDLAGKGGMVWIKNRTSAYSPLLFDTLRGAPNSLTTVSSNGQFNNTTSLTSFTSSSFTVGSGLGVNESGSSHVSWTFRKAAKFFDVVTYTGDGVTDRALAHNLGSDPGFVIAKAVGTTSNWGVWHRGTGANNDFTGFQLNNITPAQRTNYGSSSQFNSITFAPGRILDSSINGFNANGTTYVAYLFAHDAGGFGDSGNESVIKCGSFTTDGSGNLGTVNLGWEPQWILTKRTDSSQNWYLWDSLRGMALTTASTLSPNNADAEVVMGGTSYLYPTATGFAGTGNFFGPNASVIYVAIRRGPMKTPTDATKVFFAGTAANYNSYAVGFPTDALILGYRNGYSENAAFMSRITGVNYLASSNTNSEFSFSGTAFDLQNDFKQNATSNSTSRYNFRRAPGFFDVVAYTGTGSARTVSHNLGVAPELIIAKSRSDGTTNWPVYHVASSTRGNLNGIGTFSSVTSSDALFPTSPGVSSTQFALGTNAIANGSGATYIAYLFASCPGVSKVGSYTGTGTTLQINCGFTNGARFVLIKRTDSTGDWYVWDTARGIVSANDPYLLLNSTAAEVTNTDYIDPYAAGFEISSTAPAAINANGGTYIYLSIA